jgi:molybdopterin-guanine dinucleotide biosynthesis protein A
LFSSIALAGGKSLRLGRNKLREQVGGRALLSRVIDTLGALDGDIIIVAGAGQDLTLFPAGQRVKIVADIYPGGGVLGGIYTGLTASDSFHNLVVACDMPFLNTALLRYLIEAAESYDAVVPRLNGFIEPLHAVYAKSCLPHIKTEIESGRRDIRSFFSRVKVRYVESEEIDRFDPQRLSLFNINTEDDLKKAREIAEQPG